MNQQEPVGQVSLQILWPKGQGGPLQWVSATPDAYSCTSPQYRRKLMPLRVWFGSMPESNGKRNWTVLLRRIDLDVDGIKGDAANGMCFYRGEYYGRGKYHADRLRFLIGEIEKAPFILDYDSESKVPSDEEPEYQEMFDPDMVVNRSLLQAAIAGLRKYAIPAGADDQVVLNLEAIVAVEPM